MNCCLLPIVLLSLQDEAKSQGTSNDQPGCARNTWNGEATWTGKRKLTAARIIQPVHLTLLSHAILEFIGHIREM
jgi:hypothetical protein